MFREQEHRQERSGVGMTLWSTGPTRGEEANEIEIGNLHESGGRILVSTLLAVIVTAAAGTQNAPAVSSAEARQAIQARVALDENTIERMLAPDLYVQTPDRKLTRQDFTDAIFNRPLTLTRFDATVLTVEPRGNDWAALVLEKLEGEIKDNSGETSKIYVMGVVRDGWRKLNDNQWTLISSEPLGQQLWEEESPPIANW